MYLKIKETEDSVPAAGCNRYPGESPELDQDPSFQRSEEWWLALPQKPTGCLERESHESSACSAGKNWCWWEKKVCIDQAFYRSMRTKVSVSELTHCPSVSGFPNRRRHHLRSGRLTESQSYPAPPQQPESPLMMSFSAVTGRSGKTWGKRRLTHNMCVYRRFYSFCINTHSYLQYGG